MLDYFSSPQKYDLIPKAQKISETDMDELQRMRDEDGIEPLGVIWF
jgi:hypothetical protein